MSGRPVPTWVLRIELPDDPNKPATSLEAWDEVPGILRDIADALPDLPIDGPIWQAGTGTLLGVAEIVLPPDREEATDGATNPA